MADLSLTSVELQSLADRLFARGVSHLSADTTEQSRDLKVASQAIRVLLTEIDRVASVAYDVAHSLTHLRVIVEG
jgi:hypothetical protein